jgi:hypothetical protein
MVGFITAVKSHLQPPERNNNYSTQFFKVSVLSDSLGKSVLSAFSEKQGEPRAKA